MGALQHPTHVNHHLVMLQALVVTACVDFEILNLESVDLEIDIIASPALGEHPHFHPPFDWLHGHVLAKPKPPLEPDHRLINRISWTYNHSKSNH